MNETIKIHRFENGLKIKELKQIIKDWPDVDQNGNELEVWIDNGKGLSSCAKEIVPLDVRHDDIKTADILIA